jgi:hypothetical protein
LTVYVVCIANYAAWHGRFLYKLYASYVTWSFTFSARWHAGLHWCCFSCLLQLSYWFHHTKPSYCRELKIKVEGHLLDEIDTCGLSID